RNLVFGTGYHCSKLVKAEAPLVEPHALLNKEHRARRAQPYRPRDRHNDESEQQQSCRATQQIDDALHYHGPTTHAPRMHGEHHGVVEPLEVRASEFGCEYIENQAGRNSLLLALCNDLGGSLIERFDRQTEHDFVYHMPGNVIREIREAANNFVRGLDQPSGAKPTII